MGLIDTHTHLENFAHRGTLDAALARAQEAGLDAMITIGTSDEDWALYCDLGTQHAATGLVTYTVGLHPCSVDVGWQAQVAQIEAYFTGAGMPAGAARPVALGECGLDRFHLPKDDPAAAEQLIAWQKDAFRAQLDIVRRVGVPLVVHSRGAFRESVEIIDASGVPWDRVVYHCFSEGEAEVLELRERGGFASFTGILTYKNADSVRAAARAQGLDRLMIETDAPYLTPVPLRGKPNESAYLRHTAEYAAQMFGVPYDEFAAITTANARRFFGLGPLA